MNVSDKLLDDMLRISPEEIRPLLLPELRGYNLLGAVTVEIQTRAIEEEINALKETARFGINRTEYNRRKAMASTNAQ